MGLPKFKKRGTDSIHLWHGNSTERFTDLGKLNLLLWWFDFRLKPIYTTAPAASKNDAQFKSGQNRLENNHLASLI